MSTSPQGPIETVLRRKIDAAFRPTLLRVDNDSRLHAHHASMRGSDNVQESHFRLHIVSSSFENKSKPARHRMVYKVLDDELKMADGIHALQLSLKTPQEEETIAKNSS